MPRSFSSFSRSVSWPVSAWMSEVLPWSMGPAGPMMSGVAEGDGALGGVEDAAQVEQEAAVVDAAQDGRARGAEAGGDALGAHLRVLDRERAARERDGGHGAAPDLALGGHERDAVALAEPPREHGRGRAAHRLQLGERSREPAQPGH